MLEAASRGTPVLIEATCNQVNHTGGYTGMTPADFVNLVQDVAGAISFPCTEIVLGGDHLGPSPWRHLAAEEAMAQAEAMVAAYVGAGFEKIHLDTSMGCKGEPDCIPSELAAARAAQLAVVAEMAGAATETDLRYVVGTEVPTPGGAKEEIERLEVTRPDAVIETVAEHRRAFAEAGATSASESIVAVVVQPGIEFDDQKVVVYRPEPAAHLRTALAELPGLVFEAHSTDYQPPDALAQLVRDGFAILKVGPALTFAFRRALYALDRVAAALDRSWAAHSLATEMEAVMLADPRHWQSHYHGGAEQERWLRHFGYSDRVRYYWPSPASRPSSGAADESPRREEHPVEPRRGVLPGSSRPRRERESCPAAEEPAAGNRSRRAPVLRGSLRRRLTFASEFRRTSSGERFLSDEPPGEKGSSRAYSR